jgi:hypothetical protein
MRAMLDVPKMDETDTFGTSLGLTNYVAPVEPVTAVTVKSAVALNDKVVQVSLTDAAEAVDASIFTVTDSDDAEIAVATAEFAPWSTSGKVVLLTLETATTSGGLYTVMSGEDSANFGGRAADATKPTVASVTGTDYNEITIEFSEAVRIDDLSIEAAEKYGDKAELAVTNIAYSDSKTIVVTTADQVGSKLYGTTIKGAADLAGNVMKDDSDDTFVGTAKSTLTLAVANAKAIDYNQVYVEFNENINVDSIEAGTFTLAKMYGDKAEVVVLGAAQATAAQTAEFDAANNTTALKTAAAKKAIVLTVEGTMTASDLYKVTVDGMSTLYGKDMTTTTASKSATFVGKAKPTGTFMYDATAVTVTSSTTLNVKFARKVDEALAEDIANYTLAEAYGDKTEVAITSAALQSDGMTVKLTVGTMKAVLYKLSTANLVDIYGNAQKTGTSADTTFVGEGAETKISAISSITRVDDTNIKVTFNKKVGSNATDVALYSINGGVGYPEAVATYSTDANSVKLTIPKTTDTQTYTLTVKGLYNADGVAMDAAGITGTFSGKGLAKTLPTVQAVVATDQRTAKIYFDRDVTDATIDGVLWSSSAETVNKFFTLVQNTSPAGSDLITNVTTLKAYQDSTDKNVLVVVAADNDSDASDTPFKTGTGFTKLTFDLVATTYDGVKVKFDTGITSLEVAANGAAYSMPAIEAVQGIDSKTLKVYFSKPVASFDAVDIAVVKTSDSSALTEGTPVVVAGTQSKEWLVPTTEAMTSVSYTATFKTGQINDKYVTSTKINDEDTTLTDKDLVREFAGNGSTVDYIASGVYGLMTDDYTIEVYFPEAMLYDAAAAGAGDVDNTAYYTITKADGTALTSAPTIVDVVYSASTNKATLTLSGVIPTGNATFGLNVNTNLKNLSGSKTIAKSSTDDANLLTVVATNTTTTNKGPSIASATVAGDRMSIVVNFNERTAIGAARTFDANNTLAEGEIAVKTTTAGYTVDKADMLLALKVTTTLAGGSEAALVGTDISSATLSASGKALTINLNTAVAAGAEGTVTTKVGTANAAGTLLNAAGVARSQTTNESKVTFAAPNSATFDLTKPVLVSATTLDADADGQIDGYTLVFNEEVDDSTLTAADFVAGYAGEAVTTGTTADDNTIVITFTESGSADSDALPQFTFAADAIKDMNGNGILAVANGDLTEVDGAAPALIAKTYVDVDSDGTVDRAVLQFSEALDDTDGTTVLESADFTITLNGVTTGQGAAEMAETFATNVADDDTIWVNFTNGTTGSTNADYEIAIAADQVMDAAKNKMAALTATDLTDAAAPVLLSFQVGNGATAITSIVFSEAVYSVNDGTGDLAVSDLQFDNNGGADGYVNLSAIVHTAGNATATATAGIAASADTTAQLTIVNANVFDAAGNAGVAANVTDLAD